MVQRDASFSSCCVMSITCMLRWNKIRNGTCLYRKAEEGACVPLAVECALPACSVTCSPAARTSRGLVLILRILCRHMPVNEWHRLGSFGPLVTSSGDFMAPVTVSVSYLFLFTPPLLLPWIAAVALLCVNVLQCLTWLWIHCSQGSSASLSEGSISNWLLPRMNPMFFSCLPYFLFEEEFNYLFKYLLWLILAVLKDSERFLIAEGGVCPSLLLQSIAYTNIVYIKIKPCSRIWLLRLYPSMAKLRPVSLCNGIFKLGSSNRSIFLKDNFNT